MAEQTAPGYTPPWIFAITNIPFGAAGNFTGIAVPFMLREAGLPLERIAIVSALALLPSAYQLFWAPVLDLGIRRRTWLILCATVGSVLLSSSLFIKIPEHLIEYQIMLISGMALVGLVASCNGALISTTVDPAKRGQAAGFVTAGNLGSAILGGGLVLTLATKVSATAAAIALFLCIFLPALAAIAIKEPPPQNDPILDHMANMRRQVWKALSARWGWTGLLFCSSPVGTVALLQLFSAMGRDYHVSNATVTMVNGYIGGFVTAGGALVAGYFLDKYSKRKLFLLSGVLTALCGVGMTFFPANETTYVVGVLIYLLIAGLAYSAFSAVVYEIVGTAGVSASTLYSVVPAAGNQAIAYTVFVDGQAFRPPFGIRGLLLTDAAMNAVGVILLILLTRLVIGKNKSLAPAGTQISEPALVNDEPKPVEPTC